MSASEIITSHGSASYAKTPNMLELYPLRFRAISLGRSWTANLLRGAFGSTLKKLDEVAYERFFTPTAESLPAEFLTLSRGSPSGLRNLPRPFVFRMREANTGDAEVGVNLFLSSACDLVCHVMRELDFEPVQRPELLHLSLASPPLTETVQRVRVRFLTPTELKGSATPEFGPLLCRIRDRISTLRALYGDGPLDLDFRGFGARATAVGMTSCEVRTVEQQRTSKGTGQTHSIGGFTGIAEYEGAVAEFIPYLEAACWTGVGRQTVWGKGEIAVEVLRG
jgi:hypothetical protein